MKNFLILVFLFLSFTLTSCELVGDIFQAGMAMGIIIVVIILGIIFWLFNKFRGR